jgi:D-glycero-D-manno-heptose 1,7-bisphosphate phosphatase
VINRGMVPPAELAAIHDLLYRSVADHGGRLTDIFFCPHRPDEGCNCRKPRPGLLFSAQAKYGIDLARSVMVGDSAKDILAGKAAGCGRTVLVQTGNGREALGTLAADGVRPDAVADDLAAAVQRILDGLDD